jgi:hypothetical protein
LRDLVEVLREVFEARIIISLDSRIIINVHTDGSTERADEAWDGGRADKGGPAGGREDGGMLEMDAFEACVGLAIVTLAGLVEVAFWGVLPSGDATLFIVVAAAAAAAVGLLMPKPTPRVGEGGGIGEVVWLVDGEGVLAGKDLRG